MTHSSPHQRFKFCFLGIYCKNIRILINRTYYNPYNKIIMEPDKAIFFEQSDAANQLLCPQGHQVDALCMNPDC